MFRRLPRSEGIDPTYGDVGRLVISKADRPM